MTESEPVRINVDMNELITIFESDPLDDSGPHTDTLKKAIMSVLGTTFKDSQPKLSEVISHNLFLEGSRVITTTCNPAVQSKLNSSKQQARRWGITGTITEKSKYLQGMVMVSHDNDDVIAIYDTSELNRLDKIYALGTRVITTKENPAVKKKFTEEGVRRKKWNTTGTITYIPQDMSSHYFVHHDDGSIAAVYDGSEIKSTRAVYSELYKLGTRIITTTENPAVRNGFSDEGIRRKKWGVIGTITYVCEDTADHFVVEHDDDGLETSVYDGSELVPLEHIYSKVYMIGSRVVTTKENTVARRHFPEYATSIKKWGVEGTITSSMPNCSYRFLVRHDNGMLGIYDGTELTLYSYEVGDRIITMAENTTTQPMFTEYGRSQKKWNVFGTVVFIPINDRRYGVRHNDGSYAVYDQSEIGRVIVTAIQ